ncbi:MAG: 8-oxo-dGTP pyrophosphatase MutT (NUDIX family) [Myxococcota bacterium]|jgi:8-oxo-dGTP pyrophosphatase MutT (NUDIX family)
MWVFPGGKVDAADSAPELAGSLTGLSAEEAASRLGDLESDQALAHYVAAVRETFEEAGVLLAEDATLTDEPLRTELAGGSLSFGAGLTRLGVRLDLARLHYLDHWVTPPIEKRRFSARFFLAEVPAGQVAAPDDHETTEGVWIGAADALARYEAPDDAIQLMPPTIRTLQRLARHDTIAGALTEAPNTPMPACSPELVMDSGVAHLVLAGDPLHPKEAGTVRARFALEGRRWVPTFDQ